MPWATGRFRTRGAAVESPIDGRSCQIALTQLTVAHRQVPQAKTGSSPYNTSVGATELADDRIAVHQMHDPQRRQSRPAPGAAAASGQDSGRCWGRGRSGTCASGRARLVAHLSMDLSTSDHDGGEARQATSTDSVEMPSPSETRGVLDQHHSRFARVGRSVIGLGVTSNIHRIVTVFLLCSNRRVH